MSNNIFFISDLHFGHKNIGSFRYPGRFKDVKEHDEWLIEQINGVVAKRDVLWILGDVAWNSEALKKVKALRGNKHLIMGNHDTLALNKYLEVFKVIRPGLYGYKNFWLSHAPIHPDELRGTRNIHGHVHSRPIEDKMYVNVCVEALNGVPLSLDEIRGNFNIKDVMLKREDFNGS